MPFQGPDYTKEQARLVKDILKTKEQIKKLDKEGSADDKIQLSIIAEQEKKLKGLQEIYKKNAKAIEEASDNFDKIDDTLVSIGNVLGKNSKLYDVSLRSLESTRLTTRAISDELIKGGATNQKTQKQIIDAANGYKTMNVSIANINKQYAEGKISAEQRAEKIQEEAETFHGIISIIDKTKVSSEELNEVLEKMEHTTHDFAEGMKNVKVQAEMADKIVEGFEGAIPGLNEINKLIKTNKADTVAWKMATFALGAALGVAAMEYFGAPIKAAMQAHKEREQNEIDTVRDVAKLRKEAEFIPQKIAQEKLEAEVKGNAAIAKSKHEEEFASQRAAISFSDTMAKGAAQFQAAAKTGLFGKSIGSIGYGAAQMSIAGIGADKVAAAMEAASSATGKMPTAKMGADMAIMAERTGTSADDIASINESFQRLDKVSAGVAMNLQEGMRNMADQAGIGLGKLMKEVAQASKEALGYQIKSGPALAKQVAYAQSLGVNFMDIAKAGKNMVLNYKDSIKSEMQLSSMLGEQVDLSEARAAFAAGDTEGGLASIKAQGLDPADMDMFQQQALQDALGGLDLNSISKVSQNTGKGSSLKAGDAKAGNQQFLGAKQGAAAGLNAQEASISAKTATLGAELEKEIEQSYLNSPGHLKQMEGESEAAIQARELAGAMNEAWLKTNEYKKSIADTAKLNFKEKILDALLMGITAAFGGMALKKLMGGGGGAGGGLFSMFGKKGGGAPGGGGSGEAPGGAGMDAAGKTMDKAGKFSDKVKSFGSSARTIITEIGSIFKTFAKTVGDVAKEILKVIEGVGNQLITSITNILNKILTSVQTIGTKLANTLGTVLTSIVDNLGKVLNKGVDIVTQIGNKLATGVMDIFNTVVGGLTKASGELPTLLGNLGKAVGAFFEGLGSGLAAFGNAMAAPSPAFGVPVGLIVVGIAMGLAKALDIASPGIKALTPLLIGLADVIGKTFVDAMKAAGPVIETIFNGIATVIKSVGDSIIGIINSITDSIAKLSGLDAGQMLAVAGGIAAMAGAIIIYGAASGIGGVLSAIGDFFGGDPVDKFRKFQQLDAGTIHAVADAITYLGRGIAGFSIPPAIADAASALGSGFADMADYVNDGEIDTINKFAFAIQNMVNPLERVHSIYPTFSSLGSMILNLGASLDKFAGASFAGFDSLFYNVSEYRAEMVTEFSDALGELNSQLSSFASMASGIDSTSVAFINLASALDRLGSVNIKAINELPWLKMAAFSGAGGRITLAQSANNSFNIAQDSAKNIAALASDSKANLQVSKNLQALIAVLANENSAGTQLIIDGRAVSEMLTRRDDNRKAVKPTP